MKTFTFTYLAALLTTASLCAEPAKVRLWPDGAPLAKGQEDKDQPFVYAWPAAKEKANGAAFVVCPGGGYGGLASDHEGTQVAKWFNGLGVSAFVLHYRLGSQGYHYPIQLMDVQRAIRHVRANAKEYVIDPKRIGVFGFSAGGHLSSMAATLFDEKPDGATNDAVDQVSARPDVAAPTYPVISMIEPYRHDGSRKNLLGPNNTDELAAQVSTERRVTAQTPPIFLFQTDEDTVVPAENAVAFYLACRKNQVPAELHVYRPGPHGVGLFLGDPVLGSWSVHLRDWLRNQGFLKPSPRTAISGKATINGQPVSWGSLIFTPADPSAPVACARVMKGNFKLDEKTGPVIGKVSLTLSYSAADVPGLDTPDGTATTHEQKPGSGDWTLEIQPNAKPLELKAER
ncbi:MAG: alpha/beta hydrolase [Verrucomicrobia bacterium]|nr:alpha/beta hydrolase [Verrucomicrobiota bacterium]